MKFLISYLLMIILLADYSFADVSDPRFKAVQKYILEGDDYPEIFDNKSYRMKVDGVVIGDFDMDGVDEIVLQVKPHYLQSPTIIIYHVDKNMKVTRVIEGLAPGPLQKRGDDYLDSHVLGLAVDLEVESKTKDEQSKKLSNEILIKSILEQGSSAVEYKDWIHMDARSGKGTYIDMTNVAAPSDKHTCENFEFSTIDVMKIMSKKDENRNYLLVKVGDNIYVYKFNRFFENGLIDKEISLLK